MTPEQIAQMAGTNTYKGTHAGGGYYDTIMMGKDGKFYLSHYSQPKDKREDPEVIGSSVVLTILKIRSKFTKWQDNAKILESAEYDAGTETIQTSLGSRTEKELKEGGAKKALIIYANHKDSIVKLTVSGGSLYNPDDTEDMRLYSYLQSFEGDEHSFMFETTVKAKEVPYEYNGESKTTYHMTFTKDKASDLEAVGTMLTGLVAELPENDARDLKFLGSAPRTATGTSTPTEEEAPF